jgi:hypothetical protein
MRIGWWGCEKQIIAQPRHVSPSQMPPKRSQQLIFLALRYSIEATATDSVQLMTMVGESYTELQVMRSFGAAQYVAEDM